MQAASLITKAGVQMPGLIYGTAWKKDRTADLVSLAIAQGFRGIDTACQPKHYHEAGVGAALSAAIANGMKRDEFFIQSKFTSINGQDPCRVPYNPEADLTTQVHESFARSKENLGTSYVDSLVLHGPLLRIADNLEVWRAMEAIFRSGGARQLGVSNVYQLKFLQWLFEEAEIKPAVIQNRFYSDTGYDQELRSWCRSEGIIYQSFWTLTANPHILKNRTVMELAQRLAKTPAQIFFRALTQIGIVPLTGTTSQIHMQEDLEVFRFELAKEELMAVTRLFEADSSLAST